jgi:glucans biosynthesis protein
VEGGGEPEEFPHFRNLDRDAVGTPNRATIHALLDSPSVTGAYRFEAYPSEATTLDVTASLFPGER